MAIKYALLLNACTITLGMSLSSQAASSCKQFAFIYQTSFIQGDGEGMQSHNCKETNFNVGDNLYSKMQSLTSAGKQDQALKELDRVLAINNNAVDDKSYQANAEICVRPSQKKSFEQLMQQIGKQKAAALERTSKHHEAINTDIDFCLYEDAARLHLILAEKHTGDTSELKSAYAYNKQYPDKTYRDKLLTIANTQSMQFIDRERKLSSTVIYTPTLLEQAVDIFDAVEDSAGKSRVIKIAETRGDELAKHGSCRILASANAYFEIGNLKNKIADLKTRARKIGADMEQQNNTRAASTCYEVAGDESKTEKMQRATEDRTNKAETNLQKNDPARKVKFEKEQADMEKELGL